MAPGVFEAGVIEEKIAPWMAARSRPTRRADNPMVKEAFVSIKFQDRTLTVIEQANRIISEYRHRVLR